jgi:FkbM family methyltransferase
MITVLRNLFELRKGAVVDVGVNLGQTLLKVKAIDPEREYIGFEPNPSCVSYAEKLIAANELKNCKLAPVGVSQKAGMVTLDLFYGTDEDSSASIVPGFRPDQNVSFRKNVAVLSYDELPEGFIPETAVIKIDVEGAELEVLRGLLPVIERDSPFIVMEILPCYSEERRGRLERQEQVEALLRHSDYVLFRIGQSLSHVKTIGIHGDMSLCDYVACPSERTRELQAIFA